MDVERAATVPRGGLAAKAPRQRQHLRARMALTRAAELRRRAGRAAELATTHVAGSINHWLTAHGMDADRGERTDRDVLGLVLDRARMLLEGASSVSLTAVEQLGDGQVPCRTVAATGIAEALDGTQYELGEGPCVEAIELDMVAVVAADDLSAPGERQSWPRFSQAAVELGVHSALSIAVPWTPLRVGLHPERRALGAINFYADRRRALRLSELDGTLLGCWAGAITGGGDPATLFRARD